MSTEIQKVEGSQQSIDGDRVRIRYRFGDKEVEVEGSPENVKDLAKMWFSQMSNQVSIGNRSSIIVSEEPTEDSIPSEVNKEGTNSRLEPSELINFVQQKAPNGQKEEVLVITYFFLKYLKRDSITLEEYTEAYKILKRLSLSMPNNMKSSVRNVVDRTPFLYNPERGQFALTIKGEELVEQMGSNNE